MTDTRSRSVRAFASLLPVLTIAALFFAFYTDVFQRPIPLWASVLNLTVVAMVFLLVILLVSRPSFMDEWSQYAMIVRRRLSRRMRMTVYTVEIGSTAAFFIAYLLLRQPDGSRPVVYDIVVGGYAVVIGSLLFMTLRLPAGKEAEAFRR